MIFAPFAYQNQAAVAPTPAPGPTIITSGLTIYVNTYDTSSYPGTGTTWTSLATGTTYNGTLFNSPTYNSAAPTSFSFDGVDDYVYFGDASSGSTTASYTWGGWVKFSAYSSQSFFNRGVDVSGQSGGWSATLTLQGTNKAGAWVVANSAQRSANGTTVLSLNTWYYLVGVWESGVAARIYVNGTLDGTGSTTATTLRNAATNYSGWWIARGAGSTNYRNQTVGMFHLYTRALSGTEITNNFNSTKTYYGY